MISNFFKSTTSFLILFGVFFCSAVLLYAVFLDTVAEIDRSSPYLSGSVRPSDDPAARLAAFRRKPRRQTVKAVYLTAHSAASPAKRAEILELLDRTELNAVVIDIKDYTGFVLYDSGAPLVNELKTERPVLGDLRSVIRVFQERGAYVILRQAVFQDPALARRKPEWAMKDAAGGLWSDRKGLSWVDPANPRVWAYNLAIAKEAIRLGADEINFDYVRFPSDGDLSRAAALSSGRKKYEIMLGFFRALSRELSREPAWISVDLFGFVMERGGEDDLRVGQRLEDILDQADYIAPMMYPSHYPPGHLGFANPAAHPAAVLKNGLAVGAPRFSGHRAKLRPWLQAFDLGAVYDGEKVRAQIDATEKYTPHGWMLWNAANRYSEAGLK